MSPDAVEQWLEDVGEGCDSSNPCADIVGYREFLTHLRSLCNIEFTGGKRGKRG